MTIFMVCRIRGGGKKFEGLSFSYQRLQRLQSKASKAYKGFNQRLRKASNCIK
jgi:hypothetical protein